MNPPLNRVSSPRLPSNLIAVVAVTEEPVGVIVDHVAFRNETRNLTHGNVGLQKEVEPKNFPNS